MNLISSYFPSLEEIAAADLADARDRLTVWYRSVDPEADTRPGSVFGDRVLLPQATLLYAMELAIDRLLGDINLGNIANGNIHNCEVATAFVQNFGKCPQDGLQATGIIRLTFNSDETVFIDRGTRFRFHRDSTSVFRPRLFHQGELVVRNTNVEPNPAANELQLIPVSSNLWVVDVPVFGTMGASLVLEGEDAELDRTLENLISVVALQSFNDGAPAASLPQLAENICRTIYSASPVHRGGISNYVLTEFPDTQFVSPVLPGDDEMTRASTNAYGVWDNKADIYVSSKSLREETQQVKLYFVDGETPLLVGEWLPLGIPLLATEFTLPGTSGSATPYAIDGDAVKLLSQSKRPASSSLLTCAYSPDERLYFVIETPYGEEGGLLVDLALDEDDELTTYASVSYYSEPLVPIVHKALTSSEVTSPLVDVLVKSPLPVVIRSLEIDYDRKRGRSMQLDQAQREIEALFTTSGYPSQPSEGMVADSMLYAGASKLVRVTLEAELRWTIATHHITSGVDPLTHVVEALEDVLPVAVVELEGFSELVPQNEDPSAGEEGDLKRASGPRNLRWILTEDAITFSENS